MAKRKPKEKSKTLAERLGVQKDPAVLAADFLNEPKRKKRALGLDFGSRCGYAFAEYEPATFPAIGMIMTGLWDLSPQGWDTGALRFLRLKQFLNIVLPDVIFYEDVKFTPGTAFGKNAAMVMARAAKAKEWLDALKTVTVLWSEENGIPTHGFGIGEIKRHATGKGNSNKTAMIEAANTKFGMAYSSEDYETTGADNECDALFVLDLGLEVYRDGLRD